MTVKFANSANSTLAGNISGITTSITVAAGTGALFPTLGAGEFFDIVLEDRRIFPVVREIARCTARSVDTLTVVRGTPHFAFNSGATVSNRVTAEGLEALKADAIASQRYLGLFNAPPGARPGGSALIAGDQYWDSVKTNQFVWTGAAWALTVRPKTGFDVDGNLDLTGTLVTGDDATIGGSLHVEGDLLVDGATTLTGAVHAGATTITGGLRGEGTVAGSYGGAWSVAGAATVGGDQLIGGSQTVSGSIHSPGTIDGAAIKVAGHDIAAFEDVSGTANMQRFPNGNVMKWGLDVTGSGKFFPNAQVAVVFDPPFDTACTGVWCQLFFGGLYGAESQFGGSLWVPQGSIDRFGFTVVSFNPVQEPEGPMNFFWWAVGG